MLETMNLESTAQLPLDTQVPIPTTQDESQDVINQHVIDIQHLGESIYQKMIQILMSIARILKSELGEWLAGIGCYIYKESLKECLGINNYNLEDISGALLTGG